MKVVTFVGGITSTAKAAMLRSVSESLRIPVLKPKQALLLAAAAMDIEWERVPYLFDDLIRPAGKEVLTLMSRRSTDSLLVNCRFAFKKEASISANLGRPVTLADEPFVQALDERFVRAIGEGAETRFALIQVDIPRPIRRTDRNVNDHEKAEDIVTEALESSQRAEIDFYWESVRALNIEDSRHVELTVGDSPEKCTHRLAKFVAAE